MAGYPSGLVRCCQPKFMNWLCECYSWLTLHTLHVIDYNPQIKQTMLKRLVTKYWGNIPINMPLCASTGPVLVQCCQHRPSTGPVLAHNGVFMEDVVDRAPCYICISIFKMSHWITLSWGHMAPLIYIQEEEEEGELKKFNIIYTILTYNNLHIQQYINIYHVIHIKSGNHGHSRQVDIW